MHAALVAISKYSHMQNATNAPADTVSLLVHRLFPFILIASTPLLVV